MDANFIVTLKDIEFSKKELASYIREAVQLWCKQSHPDSFDFYIGDGATVKSVKEKK